MRLARVGSNPTLLFLFYFMNLLLIHRLYSPDLICGSGNGDSSFIEYGHGTGSGSGNESGYNEAYGEGSGFGCGFGYGDGYGEGYGDGEGHGDGGGEGYGYGDESL